MFSRQLQASGWPFWALLATTLISANVSGQETADYFRQNCMSCHTIGGGKLTGPDLKDVTKRKDRQWLVEFILDPDSKLNDPSDSYAQQILQEANGVKMPKTFGITKDRAERLLDLIEAESKLPNSQFAGLKIPDRPFTSKDVENGRQYFFGYQRFAKGAPSCVSCHTVAEAGYLGGGRLGPDLTKVYERLQGRKTLASWLAAPATPTMLPIYKQHPLENQEILALVAYLEHSATQTSSEDSVARFNFFLLGLAGVVVTLVVFEYLWKGRFRSARKALVLESTTKNQNSKVHKEESAVS